MNTAILYVKKGSQHSDDLLKYLADGGIDEVNQKGLYLYIITVSKSDKKKIETKKGVKAYPTLDIGGEKKVGFEAIKAVFENGYKAPARPAEASVDSDDENIKNYLESMVRDEDGWGSKEDEMDKSSAQRRMADFEQRRKELAPESAKKSQALFDRIEGKSGGGRTHAPARPAAAPANNIENDSEDLLNDYFQQAIKHER
ncbi:hypothetical protein BNJ_00409 [Kaumoebavirus]|uniref:hypothetical protein n=1 Tax=Kaumoebavirus TaxID=1859492 RepID=UPI0009C270FD|nr:hypothetical protein BNJ_00409 [Kaumoebavirus]ARA72227.1 hypothetical protein BNJ_00409 [Kaumoebavirus]